MKNLFSKLVNMREKSQAIFSGVTDIIVVEQQDGTLSSTPFNVRFGKLKYMDPEIEQIVEILSLNTVPQIVKTELIKITLIVNGVQTNAEFFISNDQIGYFAYHNLQEMQEINKRTQSNNSFMHIKLDSQKDYEYQLITKLQKNLTILSAIPTQETLKSLNLQKGLNKIIYQINCNKLGIQEVQCELFYIDYHQKIFISDIDGTITKSPAIGMIYSTLGKDYTQEGICQLYNKFDQAGYLILYMSARSMSQYQSTKEYIQRQKENEYSLPPGPMLLNTQELLEALTVEVIKKQTDILKSRMLNDLVTAIGQTGTIQGGIGDRLNDIQAYKMANISYDRILLVNKKGNIIRIDENGKQYNTSIKELTEHFQELF